MDEMDEPREPIFNYNGVGSGKIVDYFGRIYEYDYLTNKYVEIFAERSLNALPRL